MYKKVCKQMREGKVTVDTSSIERDETAPSAAPKPTAGAGGEATAAREERAKKMDTVVAEGEEGGDMKGYKMVNGKKTSYFHTELTDEAKQLLAANAGPKKLDASALAEMEASKAAAGGGSAWNSAKTFEEKDMTKWSKQRLEALVAQVRNAGCSRAASPQQSSATESFLRCWGSGQVEGPFEHDVAVRYRPPVLVSYAWMKCRLTHPLVVALAGNATVHKGQEGGWRRVHPCYPWQEALSVRPQHHCDMGGALYLERWGGFSAFKSLSVAGRIHRLKEPQG